MIYFAAKLLLDFKYNFAKVKKAVIIVFMKKEYLLYLLMILPPFFWAGNLIAGKAVSDQHIPIGLSFWGWFFATLVFTPFALKNKEKENENEKL